MGLTDPVMASVRSRLEQFIREIGSISPNDRDFDQQSELFDSGYLDSLGVVSLTAYIDEEFGVTMTEEMLFDERFNTIAGIAEIIVAHSEEPGT